MTEQEIEQARADVDQLDIEQLRCGVLLQLLHIEALKKERDEWLARHAECCRLMGECMQDRADMATERDALAADAARYRWLRSSRHNDATVMTYVDGLDDWVAWADGEDVDTSVDTAMSQAGVK
jgi:hypothetical protein